MFDRNIFEDAQDRISVETLCRTQNRGVKFVLLAGQDVGPCPICTPDDTVGSWFKIRDRLWHCFRGCGGGDVVELERRLHGGTMLEAAKRLVGMPEQPKAQPRRAMSPPADERETPSAQLGRALWSERKPFAGSLGEAYLLARGIAPEVVAAAAPNLGFHPQAKWAWDPAAKRWSHAPAMLALSVVADEDGKALATGGIHATYLAPDGSGKAVGGRRTKIMRGPQMRDGKAGGTWLIGPNAPWLEGVSGSVGAEGIETSLSLATLSFLRHGVVPRAWAALSLDRLQGRLLIDRQGCVDLKNLTPKPEGPAFVWPGQDDVEIGVDRDMGSVPIRGRTGRGKPVMYDLDGEARARLCARMATAAWKAAGAKRVHAIAPPAGMDFNNELGRVLAQRAREGVAA